MRNYLKFLPTFLLMALLTLVASFFIGSTQLDTVPRLVLSVVVLFPIALLVFKIFEHQFPVPSNLGTEDVKSFFSSKIFWLAFFSLVSVVLKGLFNIDFDEETQQEIVNMDWTNIVQALLSVALIIIRKFDILKFLN